jgi:uncharacterized protein (TIRG00374 family)
VTERSRRFKWLIPLAKILFAVAIFAFLFSIVPLRDELVLPQAAAEDVVVDGRIAALPDGRVRLATTDESGREVTYVVTPSPADGAEIVAAIRETDGVALWPVEPPPLDANGLPKVAELHRGLLSVARDADPGLLAIALFALFVATLIAAYRWYLLLAAAGLETALPRVFALTFIGALFNNIMPGMTGGDLPKAFYIAREHRSRKTEAIITVLLDRVLGITGLAMVAALVIPVDFAKYAEVAFWIYGILAARAIGGCVFFSRRLRRALGIEKLFAVLPFEGIFRKIDETLFIYRYRRKTIAVSLLLSMVVHTVIIVGIAIIGRAIGMKTPFVSYFAIVPIGLIVKALPIAPAGWGVGEAAFVYFFGTQGVIKAQALALSLIYNLEQMAISALGVIPLARLKERVSSAEVERFAESAADEDERNGSRPPPAT